MPLMTAVCIKSWMPVGSPFHGSTRALTFLASPSLYMRIVVSQLVLGVASPRAMWERLYPGCYSFISALWEKQQHPYLLHLIWKRHTWGLSTRSEPIWWQMKGSLQDSGWLFFFCLFGQMFKALPASAALMHFHRNVSALISLRAIFSDSANTNMQKYL